MIRIAILVAAFVGLNAVSPLKADPDFLLPVAKDLQLNEQQVSEEIQANAQLSPERVASLIKLAHDNKYQLSWQITGKAVGPSELMKFNEMNYDKCKNWRLWARKCGELRSLTSLHQYCRSTMEEAAERCAGLYVKYHFRSVAERLFLWTIWKAVEAKKETKLLVVDSPLGVGAGI